MTKLRQFLSIPVFSVLILMGFICYITIFIFIENWVGLQSSAGTLNALIFTFMGFLCAFSFSACVLTDAGHVPSSFSPDVEGNDYELINNVSQMKKCEKCNSFKPPRAHHCRTCRRCILRMDHHCLWINNCVGYRNYKAFFTLVLYSAAASIYSMIMILSSVFSGKLDFGGRFPLKLFYILSTGLMIGLSATLGSFLGWHIYLITHNMTTIEYYEGIRAAWLARKSGQTYRHQFDLTVYKNISLVLGPNMLKWLCPTAVGHLKDGMNFPTSHDN